MSTVKVVPETSWSLPTFSKEPTVASSTDSRLGNSVTKEEYTYIFCMLVTMCVFLWTFKKRV